MAANSVEIPLQVNVSTADPNETVKALDRIPAFIGSNLLTDKGPPDELDHTSNNGIYQEGGITNQELMEVNALGGNYNYLTENGQNIQLADAGNDPYSNIPMRSLSIEGKFIDYVPSHGLESLQAISGQYDDMILTDGNPVGMKVLANQSNVPVSGSGGTAWTFRTTTAPAGVWISVAYGNGLWVAVANTTFTTAGIATSPDGITWTFRTTTAPGGGGWISVAYGNGLWVAVANTTSTTAGIATSPDGITWTFRTTGTPAGNWVDIYYGNGQWIAVASTTSISAGIATSPDGIIWTFQTTPVPAANWLSISYGNRLWIAVSFTSSTTAAIATSPDGITWTFRTTGTPGGSWRTAIYGNGQWVAVAFTTSTTAGIATSPDGITWTFRTTTAPANNWFSVAYGNGLFMAVASTASTTAGIATSSDGITWTFQTTTAPGDSWSASFYGNNLWVIVAQTTSTTAGIATSPVTLSGQLIVRIDEINSSGTVVNTVQRTISSAGFGAPCALVRQCLGNSFTWASTQYILCADGSTANYNVFSDLGVAQITVGADRILTASWAGGSPKYLWACKFVSKNEFVCVAQGGTGNPTAYMINTGVAVYSTYAWAVMQSKNAFNRVILTGQANTAANANYIGISGYNVFTATYALVPVQNAVDANADVAATSCYAYLDVARGTAFNHYYSGYKDPATGGTLAQAGGLFQTTASSQGAIRGFGRPSFTNASDYGSKPIMEFRVMMAPLYSLDSSGVKTTTVTGAQPVGISVAMCYDGLGNVPMGVPLSAYGEFDITFAPQIGPNWDTCLWRYNGVYYYAKISTTPAKAIQKISPRLYKINTISPVNVLDSVAKTLNLGSNDYTGGAVLTAGGITAGLVNFMAYGLYANSVDTGKEAIPNGDTASLAQTPVGATQPSVHINSGYFPIYRYTTFNSAQAGGPIQDSSGRTVATSALTVSAYNSINQYPAYVANPTIPVPLGLNWSGRSISTSSSATSQSFQETYITGGFRGGSPNISADYDGYLVGNVVYTNAVTFTLFSTNYLFDGRTIYQINFSGNYIQLPLQKAVPADGLVYLASSQDKAYFLSAFDNSVYIFDGGRSLYKMRKFTLNGAITDGVFNVRDNTLMLNATTQWIWMRDGIISFDNKTANQLGQTVRFYDTTKGIYVGNDFKLWQYGYAQSALTVPTGVTGALSVVPMDFQSAFYGLGSNKISRELDYYLSAYSATKAKLSLNVTIYGFDQDERKGYVNLNPQLTVVNINPSDYDDAGYYRFSVTPKFSKVLASSVGVQCTGKIALVEAILRYDDEGIEAVFAQGRRAK